MNCDLHDVFCQKFLIQCKFGKFNGIQKLLELIIKMKYLAILIVFAFAITNTNSQMSFDLSSASYQISSGFWSVSIPVIGGINPVSYNFQTIPAGWIQSGNALNIPSAAAAAGGTWSVKVIVSDALGNTLQSSLLIKINGGAIYIGAYPYTQIFTFSASGAATASPASSTLLTTPTTTTTTTTTTPTNTFANPSSTAGVITLQASGTGANTALPTDGQLDTLINSGDIVTITQTVQKVISSSLSCTQKTGYLNDFLGRIQSYISIKQGQATQLTNIITSSQAQVNSLTNQINNYTASIAALNIPALQGQLSTFLFNLQNSYDAYNNGNVDLTPYNLNITANLQSISQLSSTLASTTVQLKSDNQSLSDTNALIVSLQAQLATAQQNKITLQARILTQQSTITKSQTSIDLLNADNVRLNNQINLINNNKQTLQNNYQALETQAQNVKNTIASNQALQAQYNSQITLLKGQLQQATINLDPTTLTAVQNTIRSLNATIPSLKQQIDYVKFNCNGVVNYTVSTLNGSITYTFGASAFSTYVTNQYGQPNSNAAQTQLGPISKVTLTPITVFAPAWISQFGSSFSSDIQTIAQSKTSNNLPSSSSSSQSSSSQFSSTNYQFASDFSCSSTSPLSSNAGVVKSIVANYITVSLKDGTTATAILGACSNILLLNQSQPKVGNTIYWRGLAVSKNVYNVYSALLF